MADLIQEVQDANGKTFSVDMTKICDINGDIADNGAGTVSDGRKNRVAKVHDIEYVDTKGNAIDSMQLLKDMASGKTQVVALDVEMEATHSGKNHNYCIYYEDSMEKDVESFVNPFKKPILKNHDSYSGEPLGRISQSWHGPSVLTDERSAIHLKARVTDQDAIPKFLDGRYSTVSISGTMGTVTCNVCGKTILKDGKFKFCGHWRGESYKDQMCYWGARDIEYHEVSTVNNPADDFAQIMKVTVVTDSEEDKDNNKEGNNMDGNKDNTADDIKAKISDMIDDILGKGKKDPETQDNKTNTNNNGEQPKDPDTQDNKDNKDNKTQDSNKEIEELKAKLEDATSKNEKLEADLKDANEKLEKAETDLKDSQAEAKELKDRCLTLATANKELVADSIISKEIDEGKLKKENKDSRKKELVAMSMKDLNKLSEETTAEDNRTQTREPAKVKNPTLANPEGTTDSNGNTADTNKTTDNNNKTRKTVDDFANDIVSKLVR